MTERQTRVGIVTGLAVVAVIGAGSAQEQSVVGETPNLAVRQQVLAEPDTVLKRCRTAPLNVAAGFTRHLIIGAHPDGARPYRDRGLLRRASVRDEVVVQS
jgi:hypothetical protein